MPPSACFEAWTPAIAAAFNAPLAGAFYAFELIIGSYRWRRWRRSSPPVVAAVVARALFGGDPIFVLHDHVDPDAGH
jgi:CIC family chloride channel protein